MNKDMILSYIDDIDSSVIESELNVCSTMLEFYDKTQTLIEYDRNGVFTEAAAEKESVGTKVKNVIKRIIAAMNAMFNKIINKVFGTESNSEKDTGKTKFGYDDKELKSAALECGRGKASKKNRETFSSKLKSFRKNHPVFLTVAGFMTVAGGVYATGKALDAHGKKTAAKTLNDEGREFIRKHHNPSANSITIPLDVEGIRDTVNSTWRVLGSIENDMDSAISKKHMTPEDVRSLFSKINQLEENVNKNGSDFDIEKRSETVISDGAAGWDKRVADIGNIFDTALECSLCLNRLISSMDVEPIATTDHPDKKDWNMSATIILQRAGKDIDRILGYKSTFDKYNSWVCQFYARYYAIEKEIAALKKDIGDALVVAARVFRELFSDGGAHEYKQLLTRYNILTVQYEELVKDAKLYSSSKLDAELEELNKKRISLQEEIKKIEERRNANLSSDED